MAPQSKHATASASAKSKPRGSCTRALIVAATVAVATAEPLRVGIAAGGAAAEDQQLSRATLRTIPREDNVTFGAVRQYLANSLPVVLTGWDAGRLSRAELDGLCGERPLFGSCEDPEVSSVKFSSPEAAEREEWGALETLPRLDHLLSNLSALLAAQEDASFRIDRRHEDGSVQPIAGSALYLHDAPLVHSCPALLQRLRAPRFFPVDFLQQMDAHMPWEAGCVPRKLQHHPSLFVGAGSSRSGLHRDALGTRFWMAVLSGTKTFRLTSQRDSLELKSRRPTNCDAVVADVEHAAQRTLKPNLEAELCPGFNFDLFEDETGAAGGGTARGVAAGGSAGGAGVAGGGGEGPVTDGPLTVWEADVSAGELIFIPEGWAHQVAHLTP